jgi:putative tryptophan/tyrosine transport system substrate-binding protein
MDGSSWLSFGSIMLKRDTIPIADIYVPIKRRATLEQTTASIPIVFAIAVDPLGMGLLPNLTRPGGNVTGLSMQQNESTGKRLELLREVVPGLRRLAIMFDGGYRASVGENGEVQVMARSLGLEAAPHEIRRPEDIIACASLEL